MKFRHLLLTVVGLILLSSHSCQQESVNTTHVNRAFYYWKSDNYSLYENELDQLKVLHIHKLYVKFFEVIPDPVFGAAPTSKSELHVWNYSNYDRYDGDGADTLLGKTMENLEIVPTVFIRNDALMGVTNQRLDSMAGNIIYLVNKYYKEKVRNNTNTYSEIQIDCDWTPSTRDNYFYVLKAIKSLSKKKISCTLRLYPYKYRDVMGIPPVDRAMLMCYNLSNPLESENKNSILDIKDLESYLKHVKKYPLHLDIALPIFSWMQVYQNNEFAGIIDTDQPELKDAMTQTQPFWYTVTKDIEINDLYLRVGDRIKKEDVTQATMTESLELIKKYVALDDTTVVTLFNLDEINTEHYSYEALDSFYTGLSL